MHGGKWKSLSWHLIMYVRVATSFVEFHVKSPRRMSNVQLHPTRVLQPRHVMRVEKHAIEWPAVPGRLMSRYLGGRRRRYPNGPKFPVPAYMEPSPQIRLAGMCLSTSPSSHIACGGAKTNWRHAGAREGLLQEGLIGSGLNRDCLIGTLRRICDHQPPCR